MPNSMDHERRRFETMSIRQLDTRLSRITDRDKLAHFIELADTYNILNRERWVRGEVSTSFMEMSYEALANGYRRLATRAREKMDRLFEPGKVVARSSPWRSQLPEIIFRSVLARPFLEGSDSEVIEDRDIRVADEIIFGDKVSSLSEENKSSIKRLLFGKKEEEENPPTRRVVRFRKKK